ncbi:MAG TPA: ABC transporter ATP-binding protein [Spirochaetales bacterium]|nr:ABC transporter ATP-binding protein [Spirochaetales bacterium]
MEAVIYLKDVFFSYDNQVVLDNVNLHIQEGTFFSIVGPNGGGKTTLVKLMLGILKPDSGEIRILGASPRASRRHIGYVAQHTHFDPMFPINVMDVIIMGRLAGRWGGPFSRADRRDALGVLDEMGLKEFAGASFADLSGGQRQRVLIARALVTRPKMLLLDEPTANIDAAVEDRFYSILKELNKRLTILLVTHDLGFVSPLVNSVICVNRRVRIHPTCKITDKAINELYNRNMHMVRHDQQYAGKAG